MKSKTRSKPITFRDALILLRGTDPLSTAALSAFNNLDDFAAGQLRATWHDVGTERRQMLVTKLRDLMSNEFEYDFSAVFYHAITDKDEVVRLAAIEGLYEDENPRLVDPFIKILHNDSSDFVRSAAATALGKFLELGELEKFQKRRRDQVYDALMEALSEAPRESVLYCRLIESIGYVTNEDTVPLIREAATSDHEELRISALIAIANSAEPAYQDLVLAELSSDSSDIRLAAVQASGSIESNEAVPMLAKLTADHEPEVRLAAIEALVEIGTDDARAALRRAADSKDEEIAAAAEEGLDELSWLDGNVNLREDQ
ncbi:MAG: HEAT repeat domain-containing protein [Anaerolineae bacterium]|nr:HEAT repeat domain-containing protein [Anaerolineae bacterium]